MTSPKKKPVQIEIDEFPGKMIYTVLVNGRPISASYTPFVAEVHARIIRLALETIGEEVERKGKVYGS